MECLRGGTYAIVDTETTGTSAAYGGIIEIGILRIEDGKIVKKYQTLIKPERRISHVITGITGITNEDLDDAPAFEEVADDIEDMLSGAIFVAHNARFDYAFVKSEFERLGRRFSAKTLCTVKLSRLLFPEQARHNLDAVMEAHGIIVKARHRAMDDAAALVEFIKKAERALGQETLSHGIARALGRHTLPAGLDPKGIRAIPNRPGVYTFYGQDGDVLYVGKSVNMRTRVLSHFSSDHTSEKEMRMCQETAHIDYIETPGELSALFLESRRVKELMPMYNRLLRNVKQLVVLRAVEVSGYQTVILEHTGELDPETLPSVAGVCRSKAQARSFLRTLAKEHALCNRLLGLEKSGSGACFNAQLELCRGACSGREKAAAYNERFEEAFERYRMATWPYPGPILIKDESQEGEGVAYVVDHWCLTERIEYCDGSSSSEQLSSVFDLDSYKILKSFLEDPKRSKGRVEVLPKSYQAMRERQEVLT